MTHSHVQYIVKLGLRELYSTIYVPIRRASSWMGFQVDHVLQPKTLYSRSIICNA